MNLNDILGEDHPDHPDYWILKEITLRMDGTAQEEGQTGVDRLLESTIDGKVLTHFAKERSLTMLAKFAKREPGFEDDLSDPKVLLSILMTLYVTGFVAGSGYKERKQ